MTIGEWMRKARTDKGWTQLQLARESGVNLISISFYENGKTYPSLLNLISIADALNITIDELIGRKETK